MSNQQIKTQLQSLRAQISHHDHLYYVLSRPEIRDAQYDQLFRELQVLEEKYPELITPDSPTQRVGGKAADFLPSYQHKIPLLSLDSYFKVEEIEAFDKRIKKETGVIDPLYIAEPKLDGLSVVLVYRNGIFTTGATRGDGEVGEEVTQNLKTIRSVPLILRQAQDVRQEELHVRGEVIMTLSGFEKLNQKLVGAGEEPFANPRNAASGALRQLDAKITAQRPLDIYCYDILYLFPSNPESRIPNPQGGGFYHWEDMEALNQWGFKVNPLRKKCHTLDEITHFHQELEAKRELLDYEIDGIVIKLDDKKLRNILGTKARSPRWAFAYKFKPREETTILEDIIIQVGRQGTLTPVAVLKPVKVAGVTVSRASLHNMDIIQNLDVRVGDEVTVVRAGDVIPKVISVNSLKHKGNHSKFSMPSKCPVCKAPVVREGVYYLCSGGYACPAQQKWAVIHYASKGAMDIENLGKETVELLLKEKLISHMADLYRLKKEDLLKLEGFKDKKAQNLLDGIEGSKKCTLSRFIYALGIHNVGEEVARLLVESLGSLKNIMEANRQKIQSIKGMGPEISESVVSFFNEKRNQKLIELLLTQGVFPQVNKKSGGPLSGKTFIFTGELASIGRSEAEEKVRSLGGKITSSISAKTSYVIVGANPGSKHDKAIKLGVKILNEKEFLEMINLD